MDITGGKGGGRSNLFQKFWGSFQKVLMYFLGCFEVVFGGMFLPNLLKQKLPNGCTKQRGGFGGLGGGGQGRL